MSTIITEWTDFAAREWQPPAERSRRWPTPGAMADEISADRANIETPALDLIDQLLIRIADGDADKAMIFMPPQAGKSTRCSWAFPLWLLQFAPGLRIVVASYAAELATRWGRAIKRSVTDNPSLGIALRPDSKAAGRWETEQGGGVYCVGIGGGATGVAADILIIDDPVKDRAEAESEVSRESVWDWWENVAKVRADRTLLIQTRWHTDDLAGRLLDRESGQWEVLSIPAIAETSDDPLGREIGEELVTPRWEPGHYVNLEKTTDEYVWLSLFQQRPTNAAGGIFKRGDWRYWTRETVDGATAFVLRDPTSGGEQRWRLAECERFVTVDLASSTKRSADWTVAAAWAIPPSGDLILLDLVRERAKEVDHAELIAPLRTRWLRSHDRIYVEKMFATTTLAHALGRAGVPLVPVNPEADKITRAEPYARLVRQNRVWLPDEESASFDVAGFVTEHADFGPKAKHDDRVDVGSYAAKIRFDHWLEPADAEVEKAYARTSVADDIPDPMAMRW